jgi:hypothetical protein
MREREGLLIGAGAGVMLVVLLVLQSSVGGLATRTETTTTTVTATVAEQVSALWVVLNDNVTVYGQTACMAINFGSLGGCPTPIPYGNGTLRNVELVGYNGSDYYSVTFPPVTVQAPLGTTTKTYTAWFTNSTICCVKPGFGFPALGYNLCP